ncbi:energy transducer TonB [Brucella sp. 21LCYQ03]|nr:energy transducer TonB [Brucella sp. 21LCYQ03]
MNGGVDVGRTVGRVREIVLWLGSGLIVLSVHMGAAMWLMREHEMLAADNMPPAAIMVELAETPEAAMTEENEISTDQETSDASAPAEKIEEPVDDPIEREAVQDELEPVELEEPEEELTQLDKIEVPLPVAKPKLVETKKEVAKKEKPVKKRQQEQASSKQSVQAQAQVTQSNRNAARQTASGLFASSMTPARWQSRLMAHLERRKKYPSGAKSRREEGVVYVRFRIDNAGKVLSALIAKSSGWPELDNEVLSLVQRASPVPAPPPDANKTITAPVRFNRR